MFVYYKNNTSTKCVLKVWEIVTNKLVQTFIHVVKFVQLYQLILDLDVETSNTDIYYPYLLLLIHVIIKFVKIYQIQMNSISCNLLYVVCSPGE